MIDLKASSIGDLQDGQFGRAIDAGIAQILKDIDNRPSEDGARKLTITLEFKPEEVSNHGATLIALRGVTTVTTPKRASRVHVMRLERDADNEGEVTLSVAFDGQENLFEDKKGN
jgi:hypothetical protein